MMSDHAEAMTIELRLLVACARVDPSASEVEAIRHLLAAPIDWTRFAQLAVNHGLAGLAGDTLRRHAADMVPDDLLDAFRKVAGHIRRRNTELFGELADLIDGLAQAGIPAIPFKGPILAVQAFGDLGLRAFRDLDFLIRESDISATIATLHGLGYVRTDDLTPVQFDLIHRMQGQEIIFNQANGTCIEPHSRLTSRKIALDIDYDGLWARARPTEVMGRTMLTLAPEDEVLTLAIHGGKELWWSLKWACDFAAFIARHPDLDWPAVVARAEAQGCRRMLLLAAALARRYFGSTIPPSVLATAAADHATEPMMGRILAQWQADKPMGPPDNSTLSIDRMLLHDGIMRRLRFMMRTLFLPGPQYLASMALPRGMSFAYIPLKLVNDLIALPLLQGFRHARLLAARVWPALERERN
jgi:hypothetical protein